MENSRCGKGKPGHVFKAKEECGELFVLDPVLDSQLRDEKKKETKKKNKKKESDINLKPTLSKRLQLLGAINDIDVTMGTTRYKYVAPVPRKFKEEQIERRRLYEEQLHFFEYTTLELPKADTEKAMLDFKLEAPSAEIKQAKLMPRKPSATPSDLYPDPPSVKELKKKQPKSGTIINVKKKKRPRPKRVVEPIQHSEPKIHEIILHELETINEMAEFGEGEEYPPQEPAENYLTKQFRKKVEQMSRTTSYQSRDYKYAKEGTGDDVEEEQTAEEEEEKEEEDRFINAIVQKFRRESEIQRHEKKRRIIKKGTFENFSFTRLKQSTYKTFYYGVKLGTISQDDRNFPDASRDRQGICMPIAAYCYSILKHPDRWTQADIDNVLEAGDSLFRDSLGSQHLHGDNVQLEVSNLKKYCTIRTKKVRFVVSEPEVSGFVRSDDRTIYNLTQGLKIFFTRYKSGILYTEVLSVAIWKDKHFYFFDAGHRTIDLYTHGNGVALMANFYDLCSVLSVLLDRSKLENLPFILYSIRAYKVLDKDAEEVDSTGVIPEIDNFQVLDEVKAVALGSFDLADKCFGFSRNKQGLTIAVVALVYSKITPPSSWHKGTVDKIVIIGNQLFLECIENDTIEEVKVEDLPAVFTIGPYVVEIHIVANCMVDFMIKKSKNMLQERLENFFEGNSNAVIQIERSTIAVWKQRNIYHCFDPYSRNREGLICRDGTACISMHTKLESMIEMICKNFADKNMIFHVHAMKVCKIHRDPSTKDLFPKCMTMNEYPTENFKRMRMKRGKRKAVAKTITVDLDTRATILETLGDGSLIEVGSTVRSIGMEDLPPMCHRTYSKSQILDSIAPMSPDFVADLDSPSLSDTQIEPPYPEDTADGISFQDLDSFDLTQEEKEMHGRKEGGEGAEGGEGEDGARRISANPEDGGEGEGSDEWYMSAADFTQVGSHSLLSRLSKEVNTEAITVVIPEDDVPAAGRDVRALTQWKRRLEGDKSALEEEPDVTLSEELAKETNFVDMPDASQIVLGTTNMASFDGDLEVMAPFVCIMAAVISKKYSIESWTPEVVNYVLTCGAELYNKSPLRYDQNYKLEIPRICLGKTDFTVKVDYIFDTFIKPRILTLALHNLLFSHYQVGILVTPAYSCALFYKNHLYYLYDGFANNEVGLGKGINEGFACLSRFQDIYGLVVRILHNKTRREQEENVEFDRFVLSSCYVRQIPKLEEEDEEEEEGEEGEEEDEERFAEEGEDGAGQGGDSDLPILPSDANKRPKQEPKDKPCKLGYQQMEKLLKIQGTKMVGGEKDVVVSLKRDYFVCLCACLLRLTTPFKHWDSKKVDMTIDVGLAIFAQFEQAKDLGTCSKKYIKNVQIDDYIFDVSIHKLVFSSFKQRSNFKVGIESMLRKKHQHFIVQFPNRSYGLIVEDSIYHLFDPSDASSKKASWTKYSNFSKVIRRIRRGLVAHHENAEFHLFEVMSITKAPKGVVLGNRVKKWKCRKHKKGETAPKKVFYEEFSWLSVDPIPWSWNVNKSKLCLWNNWFVEFPNDLFSLFGSISPLEERFPKQYRRKQTLGNLVVAIGMMQIYDLSEWSVNIMDAVLIHGDAFFQNCIKDITDENYEIAFEDIKKECEIFPYKFRVQFTPIIEGTIFLVRLKQFNLYKALRYFFDDYLKRFGVICVTKSEKDKRLFAFGKTQDREYFLYDCITLGPPMYNAKYCGVPYILRATTINRLLHVMTLALRGGDFYIFEVGLSELKPVAPPSEEQKEKEKKEEKPEEEEEEEGKPPKVVEVEPQPPKEVEPQPPKEVEQQPPKEVEPEPQPPPPPPPEEA